VSFASGAMLPRGQAAEETETAKPNFDPAAWSDLTQAFAQRPDTTAEFTERRFFPFKNEPAVLKGEARVSRQRGLSLDYLSPDQRTVIVDDAGLALREKGKTTVPTADERTAAINRAMLNILHFDFPALLAEFELSGERTATTWSLTLVPRSAAVQQAFRRIIVSGESAVVKRIELRRSQKQYIEILLSEARPPAAFTPEEVARYFAEP
jgi:outer membrane lipoprotein-sorting protein